MTYQRPLRIETINRQWRHSDDSTSRQWSSAIFQASFEHCTMPTAIWRISPACARGITGRRSDAADIVTGLSAATFRDDARSLRRIISDDEAEMPAIAGEQETNIAPVSTPPPTIPWLPSFGAYLPWRDCAWCRYPSRAAITLSAAGLPLDARFLLRFTCQKSGMCAKPLKSASRAIS